MPHYRVPCRKEGVKNCKQHSASVSCTQTTWYKVTLRCSGTLEVYGWQVAKMCDTLNGGEETN